MSRPDIDFPTDVQSEVEEHCFSRVDAEVGGFLIGRIDEEGTHITAARPALAAQSGQTHLTFTHDAWDEILPLLETDYAGQSIVGWYHSHPGFGVFLSEYDIFIQENFFGAPGQVALVVDPLAGTYGFLTASGGEVQEEMLGKTTREPIGRAGADKVDAVTAEDKARVRWLPLVLVAIVMGILAAAAGWFVGSLQGQDQAARSAQGQIDGLRQEILVLQDQLAAASLPTAAPTAEPTPEPTPTPEPSAAPTPAGPAPGDAVSVTIEHVLAPDETLWEVAVKYLGSGDRYTEIVDANPGIDPENLQPGETIVVPLVATLTTSGGQ
jgi:proteasome lid subunit RPN8/RPN11